MDNQHLNQPDDTESMKEAVKDLKLLYVDDNKSLTSLFLILGEEYGFQAFVSNSVEEGVATALKELPDVILSDIKMPGGNGFELIGELKAHEATQNIPLIGCSVTYGSSGEDWLMFGGNKFVNDKPYSLEVLQRILKGVIDRLNN